jgi:3-dehydroquinate synthase
VKHALIVESTPAGVGEAPGGFFRWTNDNLLKLRMGDAPLFLNLVARNVRIKASVVEADEREEADSAAGGRALLNLGHTYAHAIETIAHLSPDGNSDHAPLMHGEAVAYGLVAAGAASVALGRLSEDDATSIRIAVERLGIESRLMALPPDDEILEAMMHDKKVQGGRLRFVLPVGLGRAEVIVAPPTPVVRAGLDAIRVRRPGS